MAERLMTSLLKSLDLSSAPVLDSKIVHRARVLDRETLQRTILKYADAYHNGVEQVSDEVYDALTEVYEQRFGPYSVVGAPVKNGKKTRLPHHLSSLQKIKTPEEWSRFIKYCGTLFPNSVLKFLLEDKLDGQTLLFTSKKIDGKRVYNLYTRGNGEEGCDISHAIPDLIRIPLPDFDISIRGEAVISKKNFASYARGPDNPDGYSTARNLVTGILNSEDSYDPEIVRRIDFVAYRLIGCEDRTPQEQIMTLRTLNYRTPDSVMVHSSISFEALDAYTTQRKLEGEYRVDGTVLYLDRCVDYPDDYPKHIKAFKSQSGAVVKETVVEDIEWTASKDRLLIPTILYTPIQLVDGDDIVMLRRALVYNAKYVVDNGIGIGTVLTIMRAGDVIPKPVSILKRAEPLLPDVKEFGEYDWDASGVHLVLREDGPEVVIRKMRHFFKTLKVRDVGEERVAVMVRAGYDTIAKITAMSIEELADLERMGTISATKIHEALTDAIHKASLAQMMAASGIFGMGFGIERFELILATYPRILDLANEETAFLISRITEIKGFKEILAEKFATRLPLYAEFLKSHPRLSRTGATPAVSSQAPFGDLEQTLVGMAITPSGFRSDIFGAEVVARGGQYEPSITKSRTKLLVVRNSEEFKNAKVVKASGWGIPIVMFAEFKERYKIDFNVKD